MFIADLHIHGRYSRATSKELTFANLERYARIKGVDLIGTGDFTHPVWIKEIKESLTDDGSGILKTKTGFPFVLQTEISLIYTWNGKGRKIHLVVLAPDLDAVKNITAYLLTKGRIDYDGRPIFKIPCPEFIEEMRSIDPNIEVIPAHVWTPYFGLFGSMSGFDSVEECFEDQSKHIHALETGLSSDPPMNWRLSGLDRYTLVSCSDLHSYWPWRIGRESTLFDLKEVTYKNIVDSIRNNTVKGTIEVDPGYGKYHLDGHRNCDVCMTPKQSLDVKKICPKCGKPLTIGVLHRVEQLADRPENIVPKTAKKFFSLIPLSEIISAVTDFGIATQKVWKYYHELVENTTEFNILMDNSKEQLLKKTHPKIADAIIKVRNRELEIEPGYDGTYGKPLFDKITPKNPQKGLGDF